MANTLRIKRRASGNAGAPASLENAELAFNEVDNILYYGKGTGGAGGTATTVEAIGGYGAFVSLTSNQTIAGTKTFSTTIVGNIDTADKLKTSRSISITGDGSWSVNFDGSGNATSTFTLANSGVTANTYGSSSAIPVITVDAKGRVTGMSTQSISTSLGISGNTGSDTVTLGTDTLAFAGSGGLNAVVTNNTVTFSSNATSSNTVSTLVSRDTSGNFSAGTITAALTGNASTATALANSRTISLSGDATGSIGFDGSANVTIPVTLSNSWATKAYVDNVIQGLDPKGAVVVASTGTLTLSGTQIIDGVAVIAGDRVLAKDQSTTSQNGIYVVAAGAWTRAVDADTWDELTNAYVVVEKGATNAGYSFLCTSDSGGTLGATGITWQQFTGASNVTAGTGLTQSGNTLNVATADISRIVVNADSIDLALTGVSASTYRSVTVDGYGRVTAGSNPTTLAGYGISDAQPLDATLTALAGVSTSANKLVYATGSDTFTTTDLTSFGRSLIAADAAATINTLLGLGSMALQAASSVAITGGTISNVVLDCGTF